MCRVISRKIFSFNAETWLPGSADCCETARHIALNSFESRIRANRQPRNDHVIDDAKQSFQSPRTRDLTIPCRVDPGSHKRWSNQRANDSTVRARNNPSMIVYDIITLFPTISIRTYTEAVSHSLPSHYNEHQGCIRVIPNTAVLVLQFLLNHTGSTRPIGPTVKR